MTVFQKIYMKMQPELMNFGDDNLKLVHYIDFLTNFIQCGEVNKPIY